MFGVVNIFDYNRSHETNFGADSIYHTYGKMTRSFSSINKKNKRNITMFCAGSTIGPARKPFYRDVQGCRKMLPRPFIHSLPNGTADSLLKKMFMSKFFQDVEDLALHFIFKIIPRSKQRTDIISAIEQCKKYVPSDLRICNTFFTQISLIGEMKHCKGQHDISPHVDSDDIFTAIIHLGTPTCGGELLIYSGKSGKFPGCVLRHNKFKHGNIHMGTFTDIVHAVSPWYGTRGAFSLNLKSTVVNFFENNVNSHLYSSYVQMGYPSENYFTVN